MSSANTSADSDLIIYTSHRVKRPLIGVILTYNHFVKLMIAAALSVSDAAVSRDQKDRSNIRRV